MPGQRRALLLALALAASPAAASAPRSLRSLWPTVGSLRVEQGCRQDGPVADPRACQGGERSGAAVELGVVLREEVGRRVEGLRSSADWGDLAMVQLSGAPGARPVVVSFVRQGASQPFGYFVLVPWQDLSEPQPDPSAPQLPLPLLVVTEQALVFGPLAGPDQRAPAELRERVWQAAALALGLEANNALQTDQAALPIPSQLQLISAESRRHRVTLQVAVPGSRVDPVELARLAPGRMIELLAVPDQGPVRRSWIAPAAPTGEVPEAAGNPPSPALALVDAPYEPKRSPDTLLDYRPSLSRVVSSLPEPSLEALPRLVAMLAKIRQQAHRQPGQWVEGNVSLGADAREYQPSDPELLESELGERIRAAVEAQDRAAVERALESSRPRLNRLEYRRVRIRHVDVMGSGRFYYASAPEPQSLLLVP